MPLLLTALTALSLLWPSAFAEPAHAVTDDAGREVRLAAPARRIISLAPHATELLFAAGAGRWVVGVSEYSDYPPAAAMLPKVGGGAGLDLERIVALQPDLVVAWQSGNSPGQLRKLERLGLTLFYSEPQSIDDIATSLERLGRLAGSADTARKAAQAFRTGVRSLARHYAGRPTVSVFYQIWRRPLMTINGRHIISAWLRLCGARNVFADLPELAPAIDVEAVVEADPQVLLGGRYAGKSHDWQADWRRWSQLRAVAGGHLYTVPADSMERQTPRALSAARQLCAHIDKARAP
jgi:iron complex transport system substrate-binding protein